MDDVHEALSSLLEKKELHFNVENQALDTLLDQLVEIENALSRQKSTVFLLGGDIRAYRLVLADIEPLVKDEDLL